METVLVRLLEQGEELQTQEQLDAWVTECDSYVKQTGDVGLQKSVAELMDVLHWKIKSSLSSAFWSLWDLLYARTGVAPEQVMSVLREGECDDNTRRAAMCWARQAVRRQMPMQVYVQNWSPAECPPVVENRCLYTMAMDISPIHRSWKDVRTVGRC